MLVNQSIASFTPACQPLLPMQDGSWAETGDRYLLKLFRDFVFHQRAPEGHAAAGGPLLDWGLVTEALNKVRCIDAD